LAVCKLLPDSPCPTVPSDGKFLCITRSSEELSIVCGEALVPRNAVAEKGWVALKLEGPFPFSVTGVLASFLQPLADAQIPIFAISTFDTDFVLIKAADVREALKGLAAAGHELLHA
jgi:hypothetical protein